MKQWWLAIITFYRSRFVGSFDTFLGRRAHPTWLSIFLENPQPGCEASLLDVTLVGIHFHSRHTVGKIQHCNQNAEAAPGANWEFKLYNWNFKCSAMNQKVLILFSRIVFMESKDIRTPHLGILSLCPISYNHSPSSDYSSTVDLLRVRKKYHSSSVLLRGSIDGPKIARSRGWRLCLELPGVIPWSILNLKW